MNEWPLNLELNYNWFVNHFVLLDEFLAIFKLFWKCMYCSSNSCGWVLTRVLTGLQMKDFKWSIKQLNKWDKTSCHFLSRATGQDWNKSIIYSNWLPWISRERERVLDIICDTWKGQIFLRDWVLQRSIEDLLVSYMKSPPLLLPSLAKQCCNTFLSSLPTPGIASFIATYVIRVTPINISFITDFYLCN